MNRETNKERILSITSKSRHERLTKILSQIYLYKEIQTFGDVINIVVPAVDQENKISLIAHHDLFPGSAGYNDNSSGVVTLLRLQEGLPENVELVFTDREECGGLGCELYLQTNRKPVQAINLDVVGLPDKLFYEEYGVGFNLPIPTTMSYYKHIPFSDSYILRKYEVPNILILTGKSKGNLIRRIFETEHCGKDDFNIDVISEKMMDTVFETVRAMINSHSGKCAINEKGR